MIITTLIKYKERFSKIGHYIHWKICKYSRIQKYEKYYKHPEELITEEKEATIPLKLCYPILLKNKEQ